MIEDARTRFLQAAESDAQRREIEQRLQGMQAFSAAEPGEAPGGGFGPREAQGAQAGPGYYIVKLTVEGRTYTTTLKVRMDPLFEEMSK